MRSVRIQAVGMLFIWSLGLGQDIQVEKPKAVPVAPMKSKKVSADTQKTGENKTIKKLDLKPTDLGIAERSLGTFKQTGRSNSLGFQTVSMERKIHGKGFQTIPGSIFMIDGFEVPVYALIGSNVLDGDRPKKEFGLLRLTKKGAEISIDQGLTWLLGEKDEDRLIYAFDNLSITLSPLEASFKPVMFKAMAFERGVVTNHTQDRMYPFFRSVVIALAIGKNELEGIIKYPGSNFVVPIRGIKFKDKWIARSTSEQPFNVEIWHAPPQAVHGAIELMGGLYTQVEINDQRLVLGTGEFLNYSTSSDPTENLGTAIEWDMKNKAELPLLADDYKTNFERSLWKKSDEPNSFSIEAESLFFKANMKAYFWAPLDYAFAYDGYWKRAHNSLDPILKRTKELGGLLRPS